MSLHKPTFDKGEWQFLIFMIYSVGESQVLILLNSTSYIYKKRRMRKKVPEIKSMQYRLKLDRPRKEEEPQKKEDQSNRTPELINISTNNSLHGSSTLPTVLTCNQSSNLPNSNVSKEPRSNSKNMKRDFSVGSFPKRPFQIENKKKVLSNASKIPQLTLQDKDNQNQKQNNPYQSFLYSLFPVMAKKFSIQIKTNSVVLAKTAFFNLLQGLMKTMLGQMCDSSEGTCTKEIRDKKKQFVQGRKKQWAQKHLTLSSKTISNKLNPYDLRWEFKEETRKMSVFSQKVSALKNEVEELEKKAASITSICNQKRAESVEWERRAYEAKQKLEADVEKCKNLGQQISIREKELAHISKQQERIQNYVITQKDIPIMQHAGNQFKRLQNEMIDYAVGLQYDPLNSSLNYQPKPFSVVEKYMKEDLESTLYFIKRQDKNQEDKIKEMSDFVRDCYRKFNVKDEEMVRVNRIKTESVRKYIDMMHRWGDMFRLKAETLTDLRKEFVVDSEGIAKILDSLLAESKIKQFHFSLIELQAHWKKVQKNYKMGNFFY